MVEEAAVKPEEENQEETPVLSEEEQTLIESEGPVDGYAQAPVEVPEETEPGEKEQAAIDQVAATEKAAEEGDDKEAAEALQVRAKEVDLPETATEEEIVAAEKVKKDEADKGDVFVKLETELAKPEGQEDLKEFNDREKAYFFQMRRDRKTRQSAEAERDTALFNNSKLKKQIEEQKPPEEEDPLKGKDPEDFMTVKDVKELLAKQAAAPAVEEPAEEKEDPVIKSYLELQDNAARLAHPEDYDAVMELTKEIINSNRENVAEVGYNLIKGDAAFAELFPAAQVRWEAIEKAKKPEKKAEEQTPKEKEAEETKKEAAKKAQEKLLKNKEKVKTTGSINAGLVNETGEVLTAQQIVDMSDLEFSRLPKPTRDRYLKLYG